MTPGQAAYEKLVEIETRVARYKNRQPDDFGEGESLAARERMNWEAIALAAIGANTCITVR